MERNLTRLTFNSGHLYVNHTLNEWKRLTTLRHLQTKYCADMWLPITHAYTVYVSHRATEHIAHNDFYLNALHPINNALQISNKVCKQKLSDMLLLQKVTTCRFNLIASQTKTRSRRNITISSDKCYSCLHKYIRKIFQC